AGGPRPGTARVSPPPLPVRGPGRRLETPRGRGYAGKGGNLAVDAGETLGLVGESGSGKSVTSLAVMGLLPKYSARVLSGEVVFDGVDLTQLPDHELRRLSAAEISMVFQDPMSSLNPVLTI